MRIHLLALLICNLVGIGRVGWADDLSDLNVDVEESMSDSDAAKVEAKLNKERQVREKSDTAQARRQAEKTRNAAEAKRVEAHKELLRTEKGIQALKAEQKTLNREIQKHESTIAANEKQIKEAQTRLEKAKTDTQALRTLKDEKLTKISDLNNKKKDVAQTAAGMNDQLVRAKMEFEKTRDEEKVTAQSLEKAKTEQAQKRAQVEAQIAQLKNRFRESRDKTSTMDAEIRAYRQKLQKLEEEAKMAESEVQQSDTRMADAKERLNDVRAKIESKEAELNKRRMAASNKLRSRSRETQEALLKIDQARAEQSLSRSIAKSDKNSVSVELTSRKVASASRYTLSKDCRVFEKPSEGSKVLGTKRAGSSLSNGQTQSRWVSFSIADGRTGFLARACF